MPQPVLGLVRCAELGAVLVHFKGAPRAEVLERLAVEDVDYETSRRHWSDVISSDLEAGNETRAKQFGAAFAEKREELVLSGATLESLGPRRELPSTEALPKPPVRLGAEIGAPPVVIPTPAPALVAPVAVLESTAPVAVPSYLRVSNPEPAVAVSAPAQQAASPTPPAAVAQRLLLADLNPDETAPIGPINLKAILPFEGTTGDETLQALFARGSDPKPSSSPANPDETVMLPPTKAVSSGAGMQGLRATAVPILSVDEYAELRAHLLVFGENHEPTLKRFGLLSEASRELLKLRFLSAFSTDDALRDRFVAKMQQLAAELRAK